MLERLRRIGRILLIGFFFLAVCAPLLDRALRLDRSEPLDEKRVLASFPAFQWRGVGEWPRKFETWYQDHFGFRTFLIRQNSRVNVQVLRDSPDDDVLLGTDGWMYLKFGPGRADYYLGKHPYTVAEMERLRREVELRRDWLRSRKTDYVMAIAPEKASVHPEHFPYDITGIETRADQFVRYMKEHSTVAVLDLRRPLREATKDGPVFYRTDTHWNDRGAWIAYRAICRHLHGRFPNMEAIPAKDCVLADTGKKGDLAEKLGIAPYSDEVQIRRVPPPERAAAPAPNDEKPSITYKRYLIDNPSLPGLVVFHDSFGIALRGLLAAHYKRTLLRAWANFDPRSVISEKPDLVLELRCERNWFLQPMPASHILREWSVQRDFPAARPVLLWANGTSPPREGFRAIRGARVGFTDVAVNVHIEGSDSLVMLPSFPSPETGRSLVRIAVESPGKKFVEFFRLDNREGTAKKGPVSRRNLQRGRNELFFDLEPGEGRLQARFERSESPYLIRALEVRESLEPIADLTLPADADSPEDPDAPDDAEADAAEGSTESANES